MTTLDKCFDRFSDIAYRLETLSEYDVGVTTRYADRGRRDVLLLGELPDHEGAIVPRSVLDACYASGR